MARDIINVQHPVIDISDSVASINVNVATVNATNGVELKNALQGKNNTLMIVINNTSGADKTVTLNQGDRYPNAILGSSIIPLTPGQTVIQLQDPSRYENQSGSIELDFSSGFSGNIFAVSKGTGLLPAL